MTREQSKIIFIAMEAARVNTELLKVHPYFRHGISGQVIGHLERIANTPTKLFSTTKPGLNIARHKAYQRSIERKSLSFGSSVFTVRPDDVKEFQIDMKFPSGVVTIENPHNR